MFLKPFRVKSQTSIKGSDRKKVRSEIGKQFPTLSEDDLKSLVPNKEDMSVMKILTSSGDNITAYCLQKNPAFFETDGVIYPSVYTLWCYPDLMPAFATWPPVFSKLQAGADLMLPGVILTEPASPKMLGNRPKHTPCCVKLFPNKSPVAVGKTALSSNDMFMAAMRGKGVLINHFYKDHLWAHGDKSDPPFLEDTKLVEFMKEKEGVNNNDGPGDESGALAAAPADCSPIMETIASLGEDTQEHEKVKKSETEFEDTEGACSHLPDVQEMSLEEAASNSNSMDMTAKDEEASIKSPTETQDELLRHCLLCALKGSVKKSDLPVLTSSFFRNHMRPYCSPGQSLDVKKSSWKKLSKFLQAMQNEGLLNVKELNKGADSVVEVHRDHPVLREFTVPDKTVHEDKDEKGSDGDSKVYQPPQITEMYLVTAATLPLFRHAKLQKGSALTAHEVREVITNYVKENDLKDACKKSVILDPVLTDIALSRGEAAEGLSWEELIHRVLAKMSTGYQVIAAGEKPVLKKGKAEPISLNVVQRGGNKKVTLIHNLETFGIDPAEFAHLVQLGVACSTAVSPLPGKGKGSEVMVQGNQVAFVADLLLDKFKLPRKYLQGTEKAPKGKKR